MEEICALVGYQKFQYLNETRKQCKNGRYLFSLLGMVFDMKQKVEKSHTGD